MNGVRMVNTEICFENQSLLNFRAHCSLQQQQTTQLCITIVPTVQQTFAFFLRNEN